MKTLVDYLAVRDVLVVVMVLRSNLSRPLNEPKK